MAYYKNLYAAYQKCNPRLSGEKVQNDVNELWKSLKADKTLFPNNVEKKTTELLEESSKKSAYRRFSFFNSTSQVRFIIYFLIIINF